MPDSATPWTVAHQAALPVGFSRQEHWSGLPFPSPGDLPAPGIKPGSHASQVDSSPLGHQESPTTAAVAITSLNGTDETITYCTLTMNLALERRDLSFLHSTDARLETQRSEATCLGFYSLE